MANLFTYAHYSRTVTGTTQLFLSCDWGTTSFRLRLVAAAEAGILAELCEPAGIKSLHDQITRAGAASQHDREAVFADFLRRKIEELLAAQKSASHLPAAMPLFLSGMASSTIGWRELPYAKAPFRLDGRGLRSLELDWNKPAAIDRTWLISGVATENEMMRGEETEIIGLMADPRRTRFHQCSLLILPGTHSKHVLIDGGTVRSFRTFMTGELFDVLSQHSILRASVADGTVASGSDRATGDLSHEAQRAFREGVLYQREHGLAASVFRVRTRSVLDKLPPTENRLFLSGLLIGAELASVEPAEARPVIVAANAAIAPFYRLAFETLSPPGMEWTFVDPEEVNRATVRAHALLLRNGAFQNRA